MTKTVVHTAFWVADGFLTREQLIEKGYIRPPKPPPTYPYKCGECGLSETLTMKNITDHWRGHNDNQ